MASVASDECSRSQTAGGPTGETASAVPGGRRNAGGRLRICLADRGAPSALARGAVHRALHSDHGASGAAAAHRQQRSRERRHRPRCLALRRLRRTRPGCGRHQTRVQHLSRLDKRERRPRSAPTGLHSCGRVRGLPWPEARRHRDVDHPGRGGAGRRLRRDQHLRTAHAGRHPHHGLFLHGSAPAMDGGL